MCIRRCSLSCLSVYRLERTRQNAYLRHPNVRADEQLSALSRTLTPNVAPMCVDSDLPKLNQQCFWSIVYLWWLGSRVVSVLDSDAEGPGFKSQSRRCRVTVLGKLFTSIDHRASVHQAAKLIAALLRVAGVTAGLAESNGSLSPGL